MTSADDPASDPGTDTAQRQYRAGIALARERRFDAAAARFRAALERDPTMAAAHNALGASLVELGTPDAAVEALNAAIAIDPGHAEAHHNLGVAHCRLGDHDQSIAYLRRAIALKPEYPDAHNNLGIALAESGRPDAAIAAYRRALEQRPGFALAANNLGNALCALGRHDEGIAYYLEALGRDPSYAEAYHNLGLALRAQRRLAEAVEGFTRAIRLRPSFAEAHANLGVTLATLRRRDEAIASFDAALAIDPGLDHARAQRLHLLARQCNWTAVEAERPLIPALGIAGGLVPPFALLSLEDHPARHRLRSEKFAAERFGLGSQAAAIPARPAARATGKLRIGYFSADFSDHATMYLAARLFELHSRDRFTLHAYSFGPPSADAMRRRAAAAFDTFSEVGGQSDRSIAAMARDAGLDIAIDLKGYTEGNRCGIFAHRAAPVQIGFLGYPGTSGAAFIDYLVADHVVIPDAQRAAYSEALIRLPHCYQPNDDRRPVADGAWTRADAGLPDQGVVLCCFNNSYKIMAPEFTIWMAVLREVPDSVLWLLGSDPHAETNLRAAAADQGIDPARLIFAPPLPLAEHLARHRLADLFVDTFNCTAHTTASDALWAGLPIVTRLGDGFAARVAGSLLHAVGLEQLVTGDARDYAALVLDLARDRPRLAAIRQALADRRTTAPLFDSARFTRHFEAGLEQAYATYAAGNAPADIDVPA